MAGAAKPNGVGSEASYVVNNFVSYDYQKSDGLSFGLFDGVTKNSYQKPDAMYWNSSANFLDITINSKCNIWRSGTTNFPQYSNALLIKKWNGSAFVDITASITQVKQDVTDLQWSKYISNLESGRYRFEYNGQFRIDSEWYIEKLATDKFLVNDNGNILSYTTGWNVIAVSPANQSDIDLLVKNNGMTSLASIPSSAWVLLSDNAELLYWTDDTLATTKNVVITGTKSAQLSIPKSLINLTDCEKISSVAITATESGAGKNRYAISRNLTDWMVWNGTSWVNIGTLDYIKQADADKVIAQGMTKAQINALTWTELSQLYTSTPDQKPDYLAIAYASEVQASTDTASNDNVSLTVDLKGVMRKAKDSEYEVRWSNYKVSFKQLVTGTFIYLYQD